MKRTNLVLDENLLGEALKLSGCPTYSAAVNEALEEYCRLKKLQDIFRFKGSDIWEGNLSEMRKDNSTIRKKKSKAS